MVAACITQELAYNTKLANNLMKFLNGAYCDFRLGGNVTRISFVSFGRSPRWLAAEEARKKMILKLEAILKQILSADVKADIEMALQILKREIDVI